jgi:penicillin-binding protein 1B
MFEMGRHRVRKHTKNSKKRGLRLIITITLCASFLLYLGSLYRQLTDSFDRQDQSFPTRIYSDVSKITLNQSSSAVQARLSELGYNVSKKENSLEFQLHAIDYPAYLIPTNHPQLQSGDIKLEFSEASPHLLKSIQVGSSSVEQVYLEPELVATLTRGAAEKAELRTYLSFDQIPAPIWKAIMAVEDQHFLDHKGLDPRAIVRAVWVNLRTLSFAQGGSTITQQLVKNLMSRRNKNIFRKVNELFLSLLLEFRFEKEKILERYLNEVYLGQVGHLEVHGVAEGAEHFFGKKVEELNLAEISLLAGMIRGPGVYSPYKYKARAMERQRLVLKKMLETGLIAEGEAKAALKMPIRLAPPQNTVTKAPFFTDYVKSEINRLLKNQAHDLDGLPSGFKVYTTLDVLLNNKAQKAVSEGVARLQKQFKVKPTPVLSRGLEGALVSVEQESGYIRALVGGKNYAESNFNRILNMKRQVGSTFKPIVYLTAFQKGKDTQGIPYGPGYLIQDSAWTWTYDRDQKTWSPRNYEQEYLGWIPLRTALAQSINTVASKLAYQIGIEEVVTTAKKLGVESPLPPLPSLSLGAAELSPIELARVYATLANRGTEQELIVIRGISRDDGSQNFTFSSNSSSKIDPAPIDLLTDCLQEVFNHGTAQSAKTLGYLQAAAGKTGTTNNHRDAWFAGYTPKLTTVVWVGLDQSSEKETPLPLTGANSALPIWVSLMKEAQGGQPNLPFTESPLLNRITIDTHTGQGALPNCPSSQVVLETFIRGQEPEKQTCEPTWPAVSQANQELNHAK